MMIKLILFDLDDTLIIDEQANRQAVVDLLSITSGLQHLKPDAIYDRLISTSSELLNSSPFKDFAQEMGISAYEILWCNFEVGTLCERERQLGQWATVFKRETWRSLFEGHRVSRDVLIDEIVFKFIKTRRQLQRVFPDVTPLLKTLKKKYSLGLVTNGISSLQRQKICDSSLDGYFDYIAVSSEIGFGKPSHRIFDHIIDDLGFQKNEVVMIGNSIQRDIAGARNAGIDAFLINRNATQLIRNHGQYSIINSLSALTLAFPQCM